MKVKRWGMAWWFRKFMSLDTAAEKGARGCCRIGTKIFIKGTVCRWRGESGGSWVSSRARSVGSYVPIRLNLSSEAEDFIEGLYDRFPLLHSSSQKWVGEGCRVGLEEKRLVRSPSDQCRQERGRPCWGWGVRMDRRQLRCYLEGRGKWGEMARPPHAWLCLLRRQEQGAHQVREVLRKEQDCAYSAVWSEGDWGWLPGF